MTKEKKRKPLSKKQKAFCHEYIIDWNATRSAKAAGYSAKYTNTNVSKLLQNTLIQKYIEKISRNVEKEAGISKLKVLKRLIAIAKLDDNIFMGADKYAIPSIQEINKMLGYLEAEKVQHDIKDKTMRVEFHDMTKRK